MIECILPVILYYISHSIQYPIISNIQKGKKIRNNIYSYIIIIKAQLYNKDIRQ